MKRFLDKKGLSMSQAQSISNVCYQRHLEIDREINSINNASKEVAVNGKEYVETQANPIKSNIIPIIIEKSKLAATQAFLMEAIKIKNNLLAEVNNDRFESKLEQPIAEFVERPKLLNQVDEEWGWNQLSDAEHSEFLEMEAYASHIGQFIHKRGKLSELREELPKLKLLEWISIEDGKKIPVNVKLHHKPEQLMAIHEDLSALHRKYEQKVNYYKAKVKNLVNNENARIGKVNADALGEYQKLKSKADEVYQAKMDEYRTLYEKELREFNAGQQKKLVEVAALRITVDKRFQPVIDSILKTIEADTVEAEA